MGCNCGKGRKSADQRNAERQARVAERRAQIDRARAEQKAKLQATRK